MEEVVKNLIFIISLIVTSNIFAYEVGDYVKYFFKGYKEGSTSLEEYYIKMEIVDKDEFLNMYQLAQFNAGVDENYVVIEKRWIAGEMLDPQAKFNQRFLDNCLREQGGRVVEMPSYDGVITPACRTMYERDNIRPKFPEGFYGWAEMNYFGNFPMLGIGQIETRKPTIFKMTLVDSNL